ncbi:MAG TPA: hypothetical protein VMS08_04655 [Candidatus Saccharimonadia bacterium]|nr:hypothetical protein [Candidatus Saccharimonadia bacterium]
MVESLFRFLITLVLLALLFFLTIWVLGELGIIIPAMVMVCLKILAVLIVLLIAWRFFGGYLGSWGGNWFGPGPRP